MKNGCAKKEREAEREGEQVHVHEGGNEAHYE